MVDIRKSLLAIVCSLCLAGAASAQDAHRHHTAPPKASATGGERATVAVQLPQVTLVRHDGQPVVLSEWLDAPGPTYVNFIFATCTTVCPVMTQIFAQLQERLARHGDTARLVSISIDPLEDSPKKLAAYAQQYRAGSDWVFLTGTLEASVSAQRAFGVYRGDKMNHPVATFYRRSPGEAWVRIEGFASPEQLLAELKRPG